MKNKYYSLVLSKDKKEADINIFGDIASEGWFSSESSVSSYSLVRQLEELQDVKTINVHLNSYGGEVAEGLAIYNALKNHKAKVKTHVDGFACSIASVIFMAGDERIMNKSSLLMIHNAWTFAEGNAEALRKQADDLDIITSASITAYLEKVNISESQLRKLMDQESWLTPEQCIDMGFATSVNNTSSNKASQSVKNKLVELILQNQEEIIIDDEDTNEEGGEAMKLECSKCGYIHEGELPEYYVCPECGASKEEFVEVEDTNDEEEVTEEVKVEDEETETTETETDTDKDGNETDEVEEPKKDEDEEENKEDDVTQKCVTFFNAIGKM